MRKATKQPSRKQNGPRLDPVHRWIRAAAQTRTAIEDDSGDDEAHFLRLYDADWALVDRIVAHRPRTMAGLAASLRMFQSRMGVDAMRDPDRMLEIFANLAAGAERIEKRGQSRAG